MQPTGSIITPAGTRWLGQQGGREYPLNAYEYWRIAQGLNSGWRKVCINCLTVLNKKTNKSDMKLSIG